MNIALRQKMNELTLIHGEYKNEETRLLQWDEAKKKAVVPTEQEYVKKNLIKQPKPVPPTSGPGLTDEEYADKNIFIKKNTVHYSLHQDAPSCRHYLILSIVIMLLGVLIYFDVQKWGYMDGIYDIFLLGFLFSLLELILGIAAFPAAAVIVVCIIVMIVKKIQFNHKNRKSRKEAMGKYRELRPKYEKYQYDLSVYQKDKQQYDLQEKNQIRDLQEKYRRNLPSMQEDVIKENARIDGEIRESKERFQTIKNRIIKMSADIGLAEKDYFAFSHVSELKELIADGRADTMVEAKNLLEQEKREIERNEYARRQAEAAEKAARKQEEALRQQRMWQMEQEQKAREQAEEDWKRDEAWRQEQRDRDEQMRRERERQKTESENAAARQGREQCSSCQHSLHCNYRYSNNGSCAGFVPRPAG